MKTIRLITCTDSFRAHLIKGALTNEGIACILHNEHTASVMCGFPAAICGIDLLVYEKDYDRARRLLHDNGMLEEELHCCPQCGSERIALVLKKGKRMRALLWGILGVLAFAPAGTQHWEYVCRNCGARFCMPDASGARQDEEPKRKA